MPEEILKSKLVNFLVADAQMNHDNVSDLFSIAGSGEVDALAGVLEAFKKAYGGLWVGGKMVVTQTVVRLSANAMNRVVQEGTLDIELPLALVRKVSVEGGFVTKIVSLACTDLARPNHPEGVQWQSAYSRSMATQTSPPAVAQMHWPQGSFL